MIQENIALFDMDGVLVDYDRALRESLEKLRSPFEPSYDGVLHDDAPAYIRARSDLIRSEENWWANLPKFKLGFDIYNLVILLGMKQNLWGTRPGQKLPLHRSANHLRCPEFL